MKICYYILLAVLLHRAANGQTKANRRQRRYLIFTPSTQFGVFVTVSIPLHPESTVSVAWFMEANYYNVDNATYFEPLLGDIAVMSRSREERSTKEARDVVTRRSLYLFLETMLQKHGYPGRPCLLRAICENATAHFLHNGLLGDVLHLVLTPSTSISEEDIEDCYYEAEYIGSEKLCEYYEYDCPMSPLEQISLQIDSFV